MDSQFTAGEWFPREYRGTCFGSGPAHPTERTDRLIEESLQRHRRQNWESALRLFERYAAALALFRSKEDAEKRANRAFNKLCSETSLASRFGHYVGFRIRWHPPLKSNPEFQRINRFVDVAEGREAAFRICPKCIGLIPVAKIAAHVPRCSTGVSHRRSDGIHSSIPPK
jgi:hypothetical protein